MLLAVLQICAAVGGCAFHIPAELLGDLIPLAARTHDFLGCQEPLKLSA